MVFSCVNYFLFPICHSKDARENSNVSYRNMCEMFCLRPCKYYVQKEQEKSKDHWVEEIRMWCLFVTYHLYCSPAWCILFNNTYPYYCAFMCKVWWTSPLSPGCQNMPNSSQNTSELWSDHWQKLTNFFFINLCIMYTDKQWMFLYVIQ